MAGKAWRPCEVPKRAWLPDDMPTESAGNLASTGGCEEEFESAVGKIEVDESTQPTPSAVGRYLRLTRRPVKGD